MNATREDGSVSQRIFVTDKTPRIPFLVDTGADICAHQRNKLRRPAIRSEYELFVAKRTRIVTYGTIVVNVNLSLGRAIKWSFVVANNHTLIIGMDFLSYYRLLVDP